MKKALLKIAATLALSGCGSHHSATPDSTTSTIVTQSEGQDSKPGHVSGTDVPSMPSDLPNWAPAFPGAKVAEVTVQGDKRTPVKSVVLTTGENMETVVAFYDAQIAMAGMKPATVQDSPAGAVRIVESASGAKDMLTIGRAGQATSITLAYGIKP